MDSDKVNAVVNDHKQAQRSKSNGGDKMKKIITAVKGMEARCPVCKHENAMLMTKYYDKVSWYKCRDCGFEICDTDWEFKTFDSIADRIKWEDGIMVPRILNNCKIIIEQWESGIFSHDETFYRLSEQLDSLHAERL